MSFLNTLLCVWNVGKHCVSCLIYYYVQCMPTDVLSEYQHGYYLGLVNYGHIQGMSTMFLLMLSQVDVTKSACNLLMVPILQNMHGLLIMKWTLTTLHFLTKETITPERHSTLGT